MEDVINTENVGSEEQVNSTPETTIADSQVSDAGAASGEGEITPPAYEPNFKFKVLDQEKEFDEFLRGAVTSKEQEDALRDLYTKAHGLDSVKEKYTSLNESIEKDYMPIVQDYNALVTLEQNVMNAVKNNDLKTVSDVLGISENQILQYAKDILDYREMDPQQRAQLDNQRKIAQENANFQQQQVETKSQYEELAVQNRQLELNLELLKPEISSFKEKFNAKAGPQAFEQAIIMMGNQVWNMYQRDLTAQEAVALVMDSYKWAVDTEGQVQVTPESAPQVANKKPVIPNVGSGGTKSPTKQAVSSIADLKRIRQSMGA